MQSNQEHKQYESHLEFLVEYLTPLEYKVALFVHLNEKLKQEDVAVHHAPVLFYPILESLLSDSIMSLAKLYEKRAERGIMKFLNFTKTNWKRIDWSDEPITPKKIIEQHSKIDSYATVISNITDQRNKYYAHLDKNYFDDSGKLSKEFPIKEDSIFNLVQATHDIISEHSLAFRKSMPITSHEFVIGSLEEMLSKLKYTNP